MCTANADCQLTNSLAPVYVKGEVFAFVGLPQNLKDLKGSKALERRESQGLHGVHLNLSSA